MITPAPGGPLGRRALPFALAAPPAGAAAAVGAFAVGDPVLVAVAVAGIIGAVLVVIDEAWALGALAAFVVLHLPEVATDFHGAPSLFMPLVAAALLGVAIRWAASGEPPPAPARAVVLVGTYVLVAIGSLAFAGMPADAVGEAAALAGDAGVAVVAGLLLARTTSLRVVVWVMVAAAGFLAAVSVVQFATGAYGSDFGGFGLSSIENIVEGYDDVRVSGPVGDPNFYGQLLVAVLPLALDRMWGERSRGLRLAGGTAAALIAAGVVLTFSRGAALALGAVLVMMAVVYRPSLRSIAGVALAGALAVPFLPPGYTERLVTLGDVGSIGGATVASIRGRTAEVTAGWLMFADRPLTGVGYGLYDEHYQSYVAGLGIELRSEDREAHSLYLEVAAETGLPGILAMGAVVVASFAALGRARRRFEALGLLEAARTSRALVASLAGFLITALFLHLDFARLFWLLVGLALAMPTLASRCEAVARREAAA